MNTAAAVRKRKEAHPELYCAEPSCLWFIGPGGKPCAKHSSYREPPPLPIDPPPLLNEYDQVRANIAAQDALHAQRAAAGLCQNCGRPVAAWDSLLAKVRRVCTVGPSTYSCAKPLFADVEDQRLMPEEAP